MSALFPFHALRPAPEAAAAVASVPYDVVNTNEARALAAGEPRSFLHVTRAEIDLPAGVDPYDARVYAQAVRNFEDLKRSAPLVLEAESSLYLYRLRMGSHTQTGLAGCFSLDEYDRDLVKKHERTRKDKEDDRTRHIVELRAQTGLVFLTYRATATVDGLVARATAEPPLYDFTAPDGVTHSVWRISARGRREDSESSSAGATTRGGGAPRDWKEDGVHVEALVDAFTRIPATYIADGHHRVASASRAREALGAARRPDAEANRFVAVAFPDTQVQILPYHRVVRDLAGRTPEHLLDELRRRMDVTDGAPSPSGPGQVAMYLAGRWHFLTLPTPPAGTSRADALDVAVLERDVLGAVLGIGDIRTDKRIDFVGGARGTAELERRVNAGESAVAFSLHPVGVDDLMAISDAGGIMPPKSTWFEPKLRDGLLVHLV